MRSSRERGRRWQHEERAPVMSERGSPTEVAQAYVPQWGLTPRAARIVETRRGWFRIHSYLVEVDTAEGVATVAMSGDRTVSGLTFEPSDPATWLLPLWACFPQYTSVTMGWRMGEGEDYKYRWHAWYRSLSDEQRARYRAQFPPPTDPERAWGEGWYEEVADVPARSPDSIADFLIGRV
jgi:hypothetical protein